MHSSRLLPFVSLALQFAARASAAAALDPETLGEQLDERVDAADDLAELLDDGALPTRVGVGAPHGAASLTLAAYRAVRSVGEVETGGSFVLTFPFGRAVAPAGVLDRAGSAWVAEGAAPRLERREPAPGALTGARVRACVHAAWRVAGVGEDDARIDGMATRARAAASLPDVRLRVMRTADDALHLAPTEADPYRYTATGTVTQWLEARLTWRLDRALFADEEVSLEHLRLARVEARAKLAARVLEALFEWQRATLAARDAGVAPPARLAAELRALEAEATLEVLTGGWFAATLRDGATPAP